MKKQAPKLIAISLLITLAALMAVAAVSRAPRKMYGKPMTLLIWFG